MDDSPGKSPCKFQGSAESGAVDARDAQNDPRLVEVVEAWAALPEPTRAGILAMVRAGGGVK